MKIIIVVLMSILLFSIKVFADQYICTINGSFQFKKIGWDTNTNTAKIIDYAGKVYTGRITLNRKFNKRGFKININIKYKQPFYQEESEFVVFTVGNGYRVIGVGYIIKNGQKYLDVSHGDHKINCLSL